jgi:homoserine kinase
VKQVRIRVPASSANLGPGFDSLGLALTLYHSLTVTERDGEGIEIHLAGEGAHDLPRDEENAVYRAMDGFFRDSRYRPGHLKIESESEIPVARGLGSSAAAVLSGLAAAALLAGREVEEPAMMALAAGVEGHVDNVAASLLGGFCVVGPSMRSGGGSVTELGQYIRMEAPEGLAAAVAVPDFTVDTRRAREVLPATVAFGDAVANQARVAMLTAAMASGRLDLLAAAMQDCLHESHRAALVPGLDRVRRAAMEAGAYGAVLSGSGPSVLALVRSGDDAPGRAMQEAWQQEGVSSRALLLGVDRVGLRAEGSD